MLTFCCSDEWIFNTLKDFAETFYTFNFSELLANISSGKDSDFEIDLDPEVPTEELVSDDRNAPSASDETTRKLLQERNNILIVTYDDY